MVAVVVPEEKVWKQGKSETADRVDGFTCDISG